MGLKFIYNTMPKVFAMLVQSDLAEGGKAGAFVAAPQGLFPAPLPPVRGGSRVLPRFTLLGRAAAKALQDGRMLDVPLSYTFYRCSSCLAAPWKAPLGGVAAGSWGFWLCGHAGCAAVPQFPLLRRL
jgi:hypothetical protein